MFIRIDDKDTIYIGDKVFKKSGKPFKCGSKIATVLSIETNPYTRKIGVKLQEDNSIVDLDKIYKV